MKATQAGIGKLHQPTKRKIVRKNQRLVAADGMPCPYCTRTMDIESIKLQPTEDHIRPTSRFAIPFVPQRTIIVCSECNFMKSSMTLGEFITFLSERNYKLLEAVTHNYSRVRCIRYLLDIGLDKE